MILKDMALGDIEFDADVFDSLYDDLLDVLRNNEVFIQFYKRDGSIRGMFCTRSVAYIEEHNTGKSRSTRTEEAILKDKFNRLVRVFDMKKNEFRSFKLDSVIAFEVLNEI